MAVLTDTNSCIDTSLARLVSRQPYICFAMDTNSSLGAHLLKQRQILCSSFVPDLLPLRFVI